MTIELEFDEDYKKTFNHIPPVTHEIIKTFEEDTGLKLPVSYMNFLLEQKWGYIKTEYMIDNKEFILAHKVIFYDGETTDLILTNFDWFKPYTDGEIGRDKYFIIEANGTSERFNIEDYGEFGVQLCIGDGYNGDYSFFLCLSPKENYGKIYAFDGHCDYQDIQKDCVKVSDSFEEFMNTFELIPVD
jgi:hypothetical protein